MNEFYMDAHMHFDLYKDMNKVLDYIDNKKAYTIAVTNLPDIYRRYLGLIGKYKYTQIAIGYHPELVKDFPNQIEIFRNLSAYTRYIGEIGLDGAIHDKAMMLVQEKIFSSILEISSGKNKVLSVHSRRASKEVLKHLAGFKGKVILHWFTGRIQELEEALKRGYYFSINPQMLKSKSGMNIIAHIPIQHILIESDAPFIPELKNNYSSDFNYIMYDFFSKKFNVPEKQVMKCLKANFREILKCEQ